LHSNEPTGQNQDLGFETIPCFDSDIDFFTGLDVGESVDWTFGSLLDDSFDFPLDTVYTSAFQADNRTLPANVLSALGIVEEYQQLKSGAATPSPESNNPQRWFSEPPQPQIYDDEVINIFLDLACNHIGSTFKVFATFNIDGETRTELYLALAAVGGLFCQVTGSFDVAKALYHDARRLLHASTNEESAQSSNDVGKSLSFCKTVCISCFPTTLPSNQRMLTSDKLLLLELYGYCSGDKRTYEFVEAFHTDLLQVWPPSGLQRKSSLRWQQVISKTVNEVQRQPSDSILQVRRYSIRCLMHSVHHH
jgi:hypothetical protein